ncbi:MAG TPA: DUF4153 domain-containing protein [Gemmatimonadales bacterium]|nr:DUF4153 domain-containing protein [Gemmatimonadales bacterium]
MRLPSIISLAGHTAEVVRRFPWTMAAGITAAAAAIVATTRSADPQWGRIAMVAALGLPLTVGLTVLAEERKWSRGRSAVINAAGVAVLVVFYLLWPGPDRKHEAIRYFQLSAGLHLLVAFLPFVGQRETGAFWQYNRRLFLGFLRAYVFSQVLFIGLAVALGALDKLFGVDVEAELYARLALVIAFVVNTAIFLAVVPRDLGGLATDTEYPRVLKVFSQYILTPLVFVYLVILIADLVTIVVGGQWPSGWIGWLVTSVAVAGLLGFLLVHPLRDDRNEAWIRTYTRWLFIGLIPAAVMLLVAFWKRVLPYGLTEPRLLGILLGLWLLAIAMGYTVRQRAGIRWIPVSLSILLLVTLYGPLSVTRLSVASQGRRLRETVSPSPEGGGNAREASAALRFLLDHGARQEIAAAIPGELPRLDWDSVPDQRYHRDSMATEILVVAGMRYVPEYAATSTGSFYLSARSETATRIAGFEWMLRVSANDVRPILVGKDSISVAFKAGVARVTVGPDSIVFDVGALARAIAADSTVVPHDVPAERLHLDASTPGRRAVLRVQYMNGTRTSDSVRVDGWQGTLFLGRP